MKGDEGMQVLSNSFWLSTKSKTTFDYDHEIIWAEMHLQANKKNPFNDVSWKISFIVTSKKKLYGFYLSLFTQSVGKVY